MKTTLIKIQMPTRERVIEKAIDMFIYNGVKSVRMDDIASALHMSKRTLYELFGDKESLLIESIKHFHNTINIKQEEASKGAKNAIEEIMSFLEQWEIHAENNYKLISSLRRFYPKAFTSIRGYKQKDNHLLLKTKLEKGVKEGLFLDDIDLDVAINLFTDSVFGMMSNNERTYKSSTSHKETLMYLITYFFRGIATTKGIGLIEAYRVKLKFSS